MPKSVLTKEILVATKEKRMCTLFKRGLIAAAMMCICCFAGCGKDSTHSSSSSSSTAATTTDMGTLAMLGYNYQYQIKNAATGMVLGIQNQSQNAGAHIVQESNTSTTDSMWHFVPSVYSNDEMVIENMLTHELLGFSASTPSNTGLPTSTSASSAGVQAVQDSDTGTDDQDWQFYVLTDGNYLIKNHYSGLYMEVLNSDSSTSATITQGARSSSTTGCTCQEWTLLNTSAAAYPAPLVVSGSGMYVHDPYMLRDASGTYWLYGTHNTLASSTNLSTFTTVNNGDINPYPSWWSTINTESTGPDMWAPSVYYDSGTATYYQYYSLPVEPDTVGGEALIALVTSPNPNGPWKESSAPTVITRSWSNTTNAVSAAMNSEFGFVQGTADNAIDPAPFVDASGTKWLVFGSWYDGTHLLRLKSDGTVDTTYTMSKIAFRYWGEEGPFIYPWVYNGTQYYYYFAPINVCCSATSTYRIIMGRATSPEGPYYDRAGNKLTDQGGTILLSTHDSIVGPGGQSVFTDIVSGVDTPTLVYHYYNSSGVGTLGINRLGFTSDGWPYVK